MSGLEFELGDLTSNKLTHQLLDYGLSDISNKMKYLGKTLKVKKKKLP